MRRWLKLGLPAAALLFALTASEGPARACTVACIEVQGPQPVCYRCVDLGFFTNETCFNSGSCACIEYPNSCMDPRAASPTVGRGRSGVLAKSSAPRLWGRPDSATPPFLSVAGAPAVR